MSASLVGSEMCIRDRYDCPSGDPGGHPGGPHRQKHDGQFGNRFAISGLPVSYTHLTLPTICSV
eukprot:3716786-Alexandrium_andersonii.AAC.1